MKESFTKAEMPTGVLHHERTVYWIKKLKPNASESLLIAGVLHDIERALYGDWKKGSMNKKLLDKHQKLCAREAGKFLESIGANKKIIDEVKHLIIKHEEGGDTKQNTLNDADSLVYLENQAHRHAREYKKRGKTKKQMKDKFDYILNRLQTRKAKQIAKKNGWYEKAVKILESSL